MASCQDRAVSEAGAPQLSSAEVPTASLTPLPETLTDGLQTHGRDHRELWSDQVTEYLRDPEAFEADPVNHTPWRRNLARLIRWYLL